MQIDIYRAPPVARAPEKYRSTHAVDQQHYGSVYELWSGAPSAFAQVEDDSVRLTLAGGAKVNLPRLPLKADQPAPLAMKIVSDAAVAAQGLAAVVGKLKADETLSDLGRQAAVADAARSTVVAIATYAAKLGEVEKALDAREAALVKAPDAPTDWPSVQRDAEVRSWLLQRSPEEQAQVFRDALSDAGGAAMVRAVLTSPVPLDRNVRKIVTELWGASRKTMFPDEATAIDAERHVVEWSRLSLALLAVQVKQLAVTFGEVKVLDILARATAGKAGAQVFGISLPDFDAAVRLRAETALT